MNYVHGVIFRKFICTHRLGRTESRYPRTVPHPVCTLLGNFSARNCPPCCCGSLYCQSSSLTCRLTHLGGILPTRRGDPRTTGAGSPARTAGRSPDPGSHGWKGMTSNDWVMTTGNPSPWMSGVPSSNSWCHLGSHDSLLCRNGDYAVNLWNLTSGMQMNPVGTNRWN